MRNPTYEQALTNQGVQFSYVEKFDLENIDGQKSLNNQARLEEAIDPELVEQYAAAYKAGDQFPPLITHRPGRGRYLLIDGNQRLQALRKVGRKMHDAYVVECKDAMVLDRLTWSFNNLVNGKRLTADEALAHAVSWVRKYGRTAKEAASEWKIPMWKVANRVRVEEIRDALLRHNVPHVGRLSSASLDTMHQLLPQGEDLLADMAKLAVETGLQDDALENAVKSVSAAKTADAKRQVIADLREDEVVVYRRMETKNGTVKVKSSPRARFVPLLQQVARMLEDYPGRSVLAPPAGKEYERVRDIAGDVVDGLVALFGLGRTTGRKAQ